MTGAYVRTSRDGCWQAIEIDQLTDAELDALEGRCMAARPATEAAAEGWKWAKYLAKWIRDNVLSDGPETEAESEG